MEKCPPLSVLAIEKGAFGSPLTMVANFTYFYFNDICIQTFWDNICGLREVNFKNNDFVSKQPVIHHYFF